MNQPPKFRIRNCVEINDESKGRYDNSNIRPITVPRTAATVALVNNTRRKVIFKNYAPFTDYITEINNTKLDDAQKIDIIMPIYNLIEHGDSYS